MKIKDEIGSPVVVKWKDASSVDDNWMSREYIHECKIWDINTVGILLKYDDEMLVLCRSMTDNHTIDGVMIIPSFAVVSVKKLIQGGDVE